MQIAFIGLGNMGAGMATNLVRWAGTRDIRLTVFDLNSAAVNKLAEQGAQASKSVEEAIHEADVIFTSLPTNREVESVAAEIFSHSKQAAVWFETSTNQLSSWRSLQAQAPRHLTMIDAPVTGGSEGAAAGALTMLLGCEPQQLDQYGELLQIFTAKQVRMGPSGAGYVAKLCQLHLNYLVAQGIGEALMLGAKGGMNLDVLYDVLTKSCAQSYVVDSYIPRILDGSYDPSFTLGLAAKDMNLISDLGRALSVPLELGDEVCRSYNDAVARYGADQPHLKIIKRIAQLLFLRHS